MECLGIKIRYVLNFVLVMFFGFTSVIIQAQPIELKCAYTSGEIVPVRVDLDNGRAAYGYHDYVPILHADQRVVIWTHLLSFKEEKVLVSIHLDRVTGLLENHSIGFDYEGRREGVPREPNHVDLSYRDFKKCIKNSRVF